MFRHIKIDAEVGFTDYRKLEVGILIIPGMFNVTLKDPGLALGLAAVGQNVSIEIDA